jgi:hypothetical protein
MCEKYKQTLLNLKALPEFGPAGRKSLELSGKVKENN